MVAGLSLKVNGRSIIHGENVQFGLETQKHFEKMLCN
jgi:hypothetical protein